MNNKKKKIIIISIILGILVLTIGLTYAMFTISKYSSNSKLIAGDIYMHYKEASQGIKLENVLPSDTYDTTSYFEFTIDGKNTTTNKDIWYEILLKHGEDVADKTRIKDNLLKFTLVEFKDGEETTVINDKSYGDLTNKRIWVNTINKNTTDEVNITYRLYMWISTDTKICAGDVQDTCDYYTDQDPNWNDIYASIKVEVAGDFNEKSLATAESCFTVKNTKAYKLNTNMTTDELNKCTTYITNLDWGWYDGETPEAFCKGTGTLWGETTFQEQLDNNEFTDEQLSYFESNNIVKSITGVAITGYDALCGSDVVIPSTISGLEVIAIDAGCYSSSLAFNNKKINKNDLNYYIQKKDDYTINKVDFSCSFQGKKLTSVVIPDGVIKISQYAFYENQLTSVVIPDSVSIISQYAFSDNQLASLVMGNGIKKIDDNAFNGNRLTNVKIPDSVITIGIGAFNNNLLMNATIGNNVKIIDGDAFSENQLTSLVIPNSVITVGSYAFSENQLSNLIIGNSVTTIGSSAFSNNKLTSIEMPDSVETIGDRAFANNQLTNLKISSNAFEIGQAAFSNNRLPDNQAFIYLRKKLTTPETEKINIDTTTLIGYGGINKNPIVPDNVTTIDTYAFLNNQLTSITIGSSIQYISRAAFVSGISDIGKSELTKVVINKSCSNIRYINGSNSSTANEYYPWLSYNSPYSSPGVTIYGSNNEVCDSY